MVSRLTSRLAAGSAPKSPTLALARPASRRVWTFSNLAVYLGAARVQPAVTMAPLAANATISALRAPTRFTGETLLWRSRSWFTGSSPRIQCHRHVDRHRPSVIARSLELDYGCRSLQLEVRQLARSDPIGK